MPQPTSEIESSDDAMIELIRRKGALGVPELAGAMGVTATAVRQRINRLMGQGLIDREATKLARGRPSHRYSITDKARRKLGNNFADLTIALWHEIREIKDAEVRRGLLQRVAKRMASDYASEVEGATPAERMNSIVELFRARNIPFQAEFSTAGQTTPDTFGTENAALPSSSAQLPVITALACPYPELAEHDRGICAVESMVLTELVGERVKLTDCRLDGASCCRFQSTG